MEMMKQCEYCGDVDTENHICAFDNNYEDQPQTSTHSETDTVELLITLIEKRPALWDHRLPLSERSKPMKDKLWKEIFEALHGRLPLPDIKSKWRNIRDKYMKIKSEVDKPGQSGSGSESKRCTTWKHYASVRFLSDTVTPRRTISNVIMNNNSSEYPSTSSSADVTPMKKAKVTSTKKASQLEEDQIDQAILKVLTTPSPVPPPADLYKGNLVCARVAEILEQLPAKEKNKLEFSILEMAYNALDIDKH